MLTVYPACFYKEKSGQYSVIFPDLNHLATCGDDIQDAMAMAVDCLAGYIDSEKRDGHELPAPSDISDIDVNDEYDGYESAFVNLVSVDVEEYAKKYFNKSVKKTLTIPAWLNTLAMEENINFSQVLQKGLKEALNVQ